MVTNGKMTNELEGVNKDVYKTDWQWQEGEYTRATRCLPTTRAASACAAWMSLRRSTILIA